MSKINLITRGQLRHCPRCAGVYGQISALINAALVIEFAWGHSAGEAG